MVWRQVGGGGGGQNDRQPAGEGAPRMSALSRSRSWLSPPVFSSPADFRVSVRFSCDQGEGGFVKHCCCQGLTKHGVSKSCHDHPHFLSHLSAWHVPKPTCPGYLWLRPNTCEGFLTHGLRVCTPFRQARCGRGSWSRLICSQGEGRDECWCLPGFCLLSLCLVLDPVPCHCAVNSQGGFFPMQANLSELPWQTYSNVCPHSFLRPYSIQPSL